MKAHENKIALPGHFQAMLKQSLVCIEQYRIKNIDMNAVGIFLDEGLLCGIKIRGGLTAG